MFFWGSYNFQEPQQVEHPDRPSLRFPAYLPPSPSVLRRSAPSSALATASSTALLSDGSAVQAALQQLRSQRMQVHHVACGMKHLVATVSLVPSDGGAAAGDAASPPPVMALYGMGNNEHGQLGHHVATYATTMTHLHLEDLMEGTVVSVACGARHTLVCASTGCVYVTGDNSSHQLGLPAQLLKPLGKSHYAPSFTQLSSLAHVAAVYACGNASFALDRRGQVYSWGEAKYGHLGHNDNGERMDPQTLKMVSVDVPAPQPIRWFERHRVAVVEVAVGKSHLVCRSETDVYTCGEPYFGKLGHGDVTAQLEPTRVEFPQRKQVERLVGIAAGDDHTLVLKENPLIGSIVYFFGKLSNGDGELRPTVVQVPTTSLQRVVAGRGTFAGAISSEGNLYVWGKHNYQRVFNGTNAAAPRAQPTKVEVLGRYNIAGLVAGGTFVVAYAADGAVAPLVEDSAAVEVGKDTVKEEEGASKQRQETMTAEEDAKEPMANVEPEGNTDTTTAASRSAARSWDVVVPHDARVGQDDIGDPDEVYEEGVRVLLRQYLGPALGAAYTAQLRPHPARSAKFVYQFAHLPVKEVERGQKVRLWMTNLYALGTVVDEAPAAAAPTQHAIGASQAVALSQNSTRGSALSANAQAALSAEEDEEAEASLTQPQGKRVKIEWQRDDWDDEVITLYSEDETMDEANANRWQPFWFELDPAGEYVISKSRK